MLSLLISSIAKLRGSDYVTRGLSYQSHPPIGTFFILHVLQTAGIAPSTSQTRNLVFDGKKSSALFDAIDICIWTVPRYVAMMK